LLGGSLLDVLSTALLGGSLLDVLSTALLSLFFCILSGLAVYLGLDEET
jgi:hypothetical protein